MTETNRSECINKEELKQLIKKDAVLIIDVRSKDEFMESHIEGAVNMEMDAIEKELNTIKEHEFIVTTCGKGGGRSKAASDFLQSFGANAKWLCGGTYGWLED